MACVFLSLGSNIGDRLSMLTQGVSMLKDHHDIHLEKVSPVYETAPVGMTDQQNFLNIMIRIQTTLPPEKLLEATQLIEKKLNRAKTIHWGPRTIDIDIIDYDQQTIESEHLTVPHKEALSRAFVLVPLMMIAPDDFTLNGQKIKDALKKAPSGSDIIWLYQETLPF